MNQLKNVKIQNSETILSYFTRISQIKEKLEAIGDNVKEVEVGIATLNGIPRIHSFMEYIQEGISLLSTYYGKNAHKKNLSS